MGALRAILFGLLATVAHAEVDTAARFGRPLTEWLFEYPPWRQALHDRVVTERVRAGSTSTRPELIFTAGGYGVGKSFVLRALARRRVLDLDRYVMVNADALKHEIPEYAEYLAKDPATAATLVHRESGHIQLQLIEAALRLRKNIIVDGSLRAQNYWASEFARVRATYPEYTIVIVSVVASESTMLARVAARADLTLRHIPTETVLASAAEARGAVEHLRGLADLTFEIDNARSPRLRRECASRLTDGVAPSPI